MWRSRTTERKHHHGARAPCRHDCTPHQPVWRLPFSGVVLTVVGLTLLLCGLLDAVSERSSPIGWRPPTRVTAASAPSTTAATSSRRVWAQLRITARDNQRAVRPDVRSMASVFGESRERARDVREWLIAPHLVAATPRPPLILSAERSTHGLSGLAPGPSSRSPDGDKPPSGSAVQIAGWDLRAALLETSGAGHAGLRTNSPGWFCVAMDTCVGDRANGESYDSSSAN
jgi:hypothetical protein